MRIILNSICIVLLILCSVKGYTQCSKDLEYQRQVRFEILNSELNLNYKYTDNPEEMKALSVGYTRSEILGVLSFNRLMPKNYSSNIHDSFVHGTINFSDYDSLDPEFIEIFIGMSYGSIENVRRRGGYKDSFELKHQIEKRQKDSLLSNDELSELYELQFLLRGSEKINKFLKSKPNLRKIQIGLIDDYRPYVELIPLMIKGLQIDTLIFSDMRYDSDFDQYKISTDDINVLFDSTFLNTSLPSVKVLCINTNSDLYFSDNWNNDNTKSLETLIVNAANIYSLKSIEQFSNLKSLEIWRAPQLKVLSDLSLPGLQKLSINQSNYKGSFNLSNQYLKLENISLYDNKCLNKMASNLFCLPSLNSILISYYFGHEMNMKFIRCLIRVITKRKYNCYASWYFTMDAYNRKLLIKKN